MAALSAGGFVSGLRARWDQLSERERVMLAALCGAFVLVAIVIGALLVSSHIDDLESDNAAMRQALRDIDSERDTYLQARGKAAQLEARLGSGGVQLEGLLEDAAKKTGVEIAETNERPAAQVGADKRYTQRDVDLRIRQVTLDRLAKFLRVIETGPNLVLTTGLTARVRDDKHEDLEVELTVSTWEKSTKPANKKGGKEP